MSAVADLESLALTSRETVGSAGAVLDDRSKIIGILARGAEKVWITGTERIRRVGAASWECLVKQAQQALVMLPRLLGHRLGLRQIVEHAR